MRASDIDQVVFYEKPFLKFERLLETYLAFAPRGLESFARAMPVWLREKLFQKNLIRKELLEIGFSSSAAKNILFSEHHISHAASAFFPSPFEKAAIFTMDGVGEWTCSSTGLGDGHRLVLDREQRFPHSLGMLYSAFTYYCGFKVNSGEYKLMGLAPYGKPLYAKKILENLIDLKEDGSFRLNMKYFDFCTGLKMTSSAFDELFQMSPRSAEAPLTQVHMDLAASIQAVTEEIILKSTRSLHAEYQVDNLCLAGGVALNCVANSKIIKQKLFKNIWVQPASGDAGGALGAALAAHYLENKASRTFGKDQMAGAYLGNQYSQAEIESELQKLGAKFTTLSQEGLHQAVVQALTEESAIGWFQGRMEYGPRALGARSIIADPRSRQMQTLLNLKVKFRESFRPFAPSVLAEDVGEWFDFEGESPYMLFVADVAAAKRLPADLKESTLFGIEKLKIPRSQIPAVTHVDHSARLQTVHRETNPRYHALISAFKARTGCPVLVNTSFNVRGEPIVESPSDAFRCFMGTDIEYLAIGNCWLKKSEQSPDLKSEYHQKIALD